MFRVIVLLAMVAAIALQVASGKAIDRRTTVWAVRSNAPVKFWIIVALQILIVLLVVIGLFRRS